MHQISMPSAKWFKRGTVLKNISLYKTCPCPHSLYRSHFGPEGLHFNKMDSPHPKNVPFQILLLLGHQFIRFSKLFYPRDFILTNIDSFYSKNIQYSYHYFGLVVERKQFFKIYCFCPFWGP